MPLRNRFARDTGIDEIVDAIEADGYAIVEDLLDPAALDRLHAELGPQLEETPYGSEDFWGHHTRRFGALIRRSEVAREMLVHPTILAAADRILLPYCASYWVNYTGIMHLDPGESAQSLHRDTNLWPFANPAPPLTLATMWAASEFTPDNGGTLVVPGSHRWNDDRAPEPEEIEAVRMRAGSVLIYTGNLIHGGGANRSNESRFGVALHYVLGWLRQEETQVLTVSREEALGLPEQVQKLMGYSLGASSLGMVDHRDPFEVLTGRREDRPRALSTPELDRNEARVRRLSVVADREAGRTRFDVEPEAGRHE